MNDQISQPPAANESGTGAPGNGGQKKRRSIYLLPNLFTTAALFAGFYAVIAAINNHFDDAAIAVLVAMVLDGLDGRIARMTNTSSEFGAEYDSMSDMVSFGVAPSLVMYEWSLHNIARQGFGQVGWVVAFLFAACAALRLARFNVQIGSVDKKFFIGLASPAAAALMVCTVWVFHDSGFSGSQMSSLALVVTVTTALLMVSSFRYYSFKEIGANHRVPFFVLLGLVFIFVFTSLDPPKVLFTGFVLYALSGPLFEAWRWKQRKNKQRV
jgi:CDP-diacylglycerol--serine O-phosphatidyltransferase